MNIILQTIASILLLANLSFASDIQIQRSALYPYQSVIEIQDDFISGLQSSGTVGVLGWFVSGATTFLGDDANDPGVLRKDTSAVSGTVSSILLSGTQTMISAVFPYTVLWRERLNNADANTTVRIGLSSACTVSPIGTGIYFEKLDADTDWFATTNNGGVKTRVDTGVPATTGAFHIYTINRDVAAGNAKFFIDNAAVGTITTNIPASAIQPCSQIVNSAAAAKTLDIGYFQMVITGLVR